MSNSDYELGANDDQPMITNELSEPYGRKPAAKKRGRPRKTALAADAVTARDVQETPAPLGVSLTFDQIKELFAMATQSPSRSAELELAADALRRAAASQGQLSEEMGRTLIRSNREHQNVSVFTVKPDCEFCKAGTKHPENDKIGHPAPKLLFDRVFHPRHVPLHADQCEIIEIELINSFTESRSARDGEWTVEVVKQKGGKRELIINHPTSTDERMGLPPLKQILLELKVGSEKADPMNLVSEIEALKARIRQMETTAGAAASA